MWVSSLEYSRLLTALDHAEQRAAAAEEALVAERAANREAERHWADMLLRAKQTFPLPKKPMAQSTETPELQPASDVPGMDSGELEALVTTGAQYGVSRADVIRELRKERGL